MNIRKTAAVSFAFMLSAGCISSALTANAAETAEPVYFYEESGYFAGDVNNNGEIDTADLVLLQKWLLGNVAPEWASINRADMIHNGIINAYDLIQLRRALFGESEPEWIEAEKDDPPEDEEMIGSPVRWLNPTLMCKGRNKLLMLVVDFPDCKFKNDYTTEQIRDISFGEADSLSYAYPYESVVGYYERSSYGALTMDADIYTYTFSQPIEEYIRYDENGKRWADQNKLLDEIMTAKNDEIDFTDYDVNGDGVMDTILLSVADNAPNDGWWPCSGKYYGYRKFDGISPGNVIIGNSSPAERASYNSTWIHELGHAMGLPDYYKYVNTENGSGGMDGKAGLEMMDDAMGDMCAFSKLMYGWYKPSDIYLYTGGEQTYTLESMQAVGNCIIIPRGDMNGGLSEYMVIEYATGEANNTGFFKRGGIRIMHCNAEYSVDFWGTPFLVWNNYSEYYDKSNEGKRVIRLVNQAEGGDFCREGDVIDGNTSGFHWYDENGAQTVDVGCKITVGALSDGKYTITISEQ